MIAQLFVFALGAATLIRVITREDSSNRDSNSIKHCSRGSIRVGA